MNCCNANGQCDQGRDCPIRKQRIKEINDAYANGFKFEAGFKLDDPYEDVIGTFRALIIVLAVCIAVTLLSYVLWGKL